MNVRSHSKAVAAKALRTGYNAINATLMCRTFLLKTSENRVVSCRHRPWRKMCLCWLHLLTTRSSTSSFHHGSLLDRSVIPFQGYIGKLWKNKTITLIPGSVRLCIFRNVRIRTLGELLHTLSHYPYAVRLFLFFCGGGGGRVPKCSSYRFRVFGPPTGNLILHFLLRKAHWFFLLICSVSPT